ncbi:MAG TPA: hypothetical protein VGQ33_07890 [Vicinamibacteria bacterium]|nr:hypothetical protein [Vicinamibacteria bacterium]
MRRSGSPSWDCPQCGRVVPGREALCYCGVRRSEAPAGSDRARDGAPPARRPHPALLATLVLAVCGLGAYAALRPRGESANDATVTEEAYRPGSPADAGPSSGSPSPTAVALPSLPPGLVPLPAREDPPPTTAKTPPIRPAAAPSAEALSGMDEAWARATELLEPNLRRIDAETSALHDAYAPFAARCLVAPIDGNWLYALKSGPMVPVGIPFTDQGITMDCSGGRRHLVARADVVKAALGTVETKARTGGVLPGHWRKLLAAHQLDLWDQY